MKVTSLRIPPEKAPSPTDFTVLGRMKDSIPAGHVCNAFPDLSYRAPLSEQYAVLPSATFMAVSEVHSENA